MYLRSPSAEGDAEPVECLFGYGPIADLDVGKGECTVTRSLLSQKPDSRSPRYDSCLQVKNDEVPNIAFGHHRKVNFLADTFSFFCLSIDGDNLTDSLIFLVRFGRFFASI